MLELPRWGGEVAASIAAAVAAISIGLLAFFLLAGVIYVPQELDELWSGLAHIFPLALAVLLVPVAGLIAMIAVPLTRIWFRQDRLSVRPYLSTGAAAGMIVMPIFWLGFWGNIDAEAVVIGLVAGVATGAVYYLVAFRISSSIVGFFTGKRLQRRLH